MVGMPGQIAWCFRRNDAVEPREIKIVAVEVGPENPLEIGLVRNYGHNLRVHSLFAQCELQPVIESLRTSFLSGSRGGSHNCNPLMHAESWTLSDNCIVQICAPGGKRGMEGFLPRHIPGKGNRTIL